MLTPWLRNDGRQFFLISLTFVVASIVFLAKSPKAQASLNSSLSSYEKQVVDLINSERKKAGVNQVLGMNEKLITAARKHNDVMNTCAKSFSTSACFSHQVTGQNESKLMDRINQTGYNATSAGEIIAYGYKTPESVVAGWMNSPGHKALILSPDRPDVGCGYLDGNNGDYKRLFWTCDFGKSSQPQQSLAPSTTQAPATSTTPKASSTPTTSPNRTPRSVRTPPPRSTTVTENPMPAPHSVSLPWWCRYVPVAFQCKIS